MKTREKSLTIKSLSLVAILIFEISGVGGCNSKGGNDSPNAPLNGSLKRGSDGGPHNNGNNSEVRSESFSYWLIQNGCSTEKQKFDSKEALCKGLQDRDLNKDCALDLRQDEFRRVGCVGEFTEISNASSPSHGPSAVKCIGLVTGLTGEKKIDQIIPWDRKNPQKIVLSEFSHVKSAGEYSVYLIPDKDPTKTGLIQISGWFIDNNKNQLVEGGLDSTVYFYHKDNNLNGREVEIKCGLDTPDIQAPGYTDKEKLEMTCLGTDGPFHGKKDILTAHFFWDQKTNLTKALMVEKNGQRVKTDMNLEVDVDPKDGLPTLKATSKAINGHVNLIGKVQGRMELAIEYMSAWDHRDISVTCAPSKVWRESINGRINRVVEKSRHGT